MGQAISTSALWGVKRVLPETYLESFESIVESAFVPRDLGPMITSTDAVMCLDALCGDSYAAMLQLVELQDHRIAGVMTPMIER